MKRKILILVSILVLMSMLVSPVAASDGDTGDQELLKGGIPTSFTQTIPINIVLIGYNPNQVKASELLSVLPATYQPVVRYPQFYGLEGRDVGLKFNFRYKVYDTNKKFEAKFFSFLSKTGTPGDPTTFQQQYNDQAHNVLDVTSPVLYIDAPSVEKYLVDHTRSLLGGAKKAKQSYTVYLINWYGREDFKFHVYTKTDTADPDTGYNFGQLRGSRKMIAWGGSYSRSWFYDLSAGPEANTYNYEVDHPDLDGDNVVDYRMPPIWEYTAGGFRNPGALSNDLGLVTRYVAINLLFTTSPLYDPMVTAPGLSGSKVEHIEIFEDDPASLGMDWIDQAHIYSQLAAFEPYYPWQVNIEDNNPIDAQAQRSLRIWAGLLTEDDCWNPYGDPSAQLFCFFDTHLSNYVPGYGPDDYVGEVFGFNTTQANMGGNFGLLGFADDNWVDGTQTYVFAFDTTEYRDLGYGFSTTAVHEFGHHIGLSHPHDGYDSEQTLDYGPGGDYFFAWSGDESNTVMHYLDLSDGFGQFDQDNMYRYETAGYLQLSADLYAKIKADPGAKIVKGLVKLGLAKTAISVKSFQQWNYLKAVIFARASYNAFAAAAKILGIPLSAQKTTPQVAPNLNVPHEGDPIRFPDN